MNKQLPLDQIAYHAITDLHDTRRQLEQAKVQLATTQAENRRLRRMTQNGKHGHLLHRAAADARQLVGWRVAGYSITRRNALSYGMSIRRWQWAIALLKLARVVDAQLAAADTFLIGDMAECLAAVDRAVRIVESGGIERLIVRLPRGAARQPRPPQR
jgi:hypothetical protein